MNYPEYVLHRSETLWRELEEAWQRELTTATGAARGNGADAETSAGENAARRLAEKIFSTGGEAAAETVQALAAQERETRDFAEVSGANATRGGDTGARWLAAEFRRGTTEGVASARVQRSEAIFVPTYETADLQTLSQSVERDARRYDGGFLLYSTKRGKKR